MRSEGAAAGPVAPLCGALSLVLSALLGKVIEGRGVTDNVQRFSSLPPYLPVSYHVLRAETSFFLKEANQDLLHNASLQTRVESFFTYKAKRPPILNASYGPFSVEKVVPLDLMVTSNFLGPTSQFSFNWKLKAHILRDKIYPSRPRVQVLFHVVGRGWDEPGTGDRLPCLQVFAFRETREVRGSCRLAGGLGLCVAELELLAGWFSAPTVVAGRKRSGEPSESSPVELYYTVQPGDGRGDCAGSDVRKGNAILPGKGGLEETMAHLQRIGAVGLYRAQDSAQLSELRLDGNVVIWLPSRPVKQGDVVTAYVTVASNSTVDLFILRAKVKKGVNILSTQSSEPRQWDAKQEVGYGGRHTTTTVVCQRLGPAAHNRSSSVFNEVVQMNFEIASFSSLSGTQPITWQVEYPRRETTDIAVSEIFISQKDLVGIVPLAMDTEILNTAILTGKTVAMPIKVVSVEENGSVTDISESVECKSADEDVIQVLSPLSDSILAEKTVTVLDDKVSVTDLAIQLVAGLSVTLHPSTENSKAITAVATAEDLLHTPKQEAVLSTWLQFSDGSVTPLDIYDTKDFTLTATSLDETIVSIPQARSPRWPVVMAEGEGQGPLVRVDMTIAEACQKSKRKSILAVGIGNVRVKFGRNDADSSPDGDYNEGEMKNHASDRRQKGQDPERAGQVGHLPGSSLVGREEGALRRGGTTVKSLLDNKVVKNSRLDGGRLPGEGQLQNIPLDFTNFPAQVDPAQPGPSLRDSDLVQTPRSLSNLEIGMYALLGVFCLAILVFLINCATFALKYRHKQVSLEGQASMTHSHDWVWLGNEAELLENMGEGSTPQDEHTTIIDRRPGSSEESNRLLLNGGSQKHVQSQMHRLAESGGKQSRDQRHEPPHSPTSKRKKVKFTTFTTIPPDDSCPTVNSILCSNDEDIKWVCQDMDVGAPLELRNYLEKLKDKV
ncbi:transmembrane protein 132C isoform X2 [Manis pentadactyla]|uniref:transmembrane protein 132C isoform X2 n=1 Tax=Manis pentadactyla TaxID=143292 RepID=UPI00255CA265|nr:transmembrane protein 132C isoform X2 [Manis pentadactyla]